MPKNELLLNPKPIKPNWFIDVYEKNRFNDVWVIAPRQPIRIEINDIHNNKYEAPIANFALGNKKPQNRINVKATGSLIQILITLIVNHDDASYISGKTEWKGNKESLCANATKIKKIEKAKRNGIFDILSIVVGIYNVISLRFCDISSIDKAVIPKPKQADTISPKP